mgnify:CR=1 FL=1
MHAHVLLYIDLGSIDRRGGAPEIFLSMHAHVLYRFGIYRSTQLGCMCVR